MIVLVTLVAFCIASCQGAAAAPTREVPPEGYGAVRSARGPFVVRYEPRFERMALRIEELLADSWEGLARELGIERVDTIVVYVTGDMDAYRSLHGGFIPEWGGAFCNSATREIGVNADAVLKSPRPIAVVVRHELSHILLADRIEGARVPRWFAEGLAMRQAAEWTFGHQWGLVSSIWSDRLPYVEDFEGPLPRNAEDARLAYGVAYCAVEELLDERPEDIVTLTAYVRDLGDFDRAFTLTFGETPADFSTRLHTLLLNRYGTTAVLLRSIPYWGGMTVLFLAAFLFKLVRGRRKLREWESAEKATLRLF